MRNKRRNAGQAPYINFGMRRRREAARSRSCITGQVMLLSIMILSGIMISAAVIGGVLVLHQIRQVNDAESSAQAVFTADTGLEYASWCYFKGDPSCPSSFTNISCSDAGVSFSVDPNACFTLNSTVAGGVITVTSDGQSGTYPRSAERILQTVFTSS